MKIGDTIWRFNTNRRVYSDDKSAPIWREHWEPLTIIGETTRSWLVGYYYKPYRVPKKGSDPRQWVFSEEEIENRDWVERHKHRISRAVLHADYYALKEVARILGV